MTASSPYRFLVRGTITVSLVLLFSGFLLAQINGPRPSVTSLGGQFTMFNPPGPRASVTSLGPNWWGPEPCCMAASGFTFHHRRRRRTGHGDGHSGGRRDGRGSG